VNPETKEFIPVSPSTPPEWPRFHVGQEFILNGVTMRVRKITKKDVFLRPVKEETP
jgi:hypothetical protein